MTEIVPTRRENGEKPPFRVPSMETIEQVPYAGYDAISTFSGAGGSCLGYRMAGFRMLWANEFIDEASEVYRRNHPSSQIDTRDIREIEPEEILAATNREQGEIDLMDGSPPCSDFSTAGKINKGWGQIKSYSSTKQRVDDLFFEYARILDGVRPKTFVAENVKGLVQGKAKGYFKMILRVLRECGYRVRARVLDAQWLGVPQRRERVIFVGVRDDLADEYGVEPAHPEPLPYRYTLREALDGIDETKGPRIHGYSIYPLWYEVEPGDNHHERFSLYRLAYDQPAPTILQTVNLGTAAHTMPDEPPRYPSIPIVKRIMAFPDDFELINDWPERWERLARSVPPVMMYHIARTIRTDILDPISTANHD